ncbi:Qat anti-phage system TatD family nuclease QatD [Tenacibaculum larymnensis]|uniref:TatD family hydrolase n=1 Tax=Tenacibaculum larymnensis TaxID=2878201 RepID=A0A9X4ET03_9FLAO|nr:Qat anti-phage system TatD family nuclease QatD [Tenacibaculum larymnensis]MDE1206017.1 TatD family hydrolase [Tenacibaculum larymnensis]
MIIDTHCHFDLYENPKEIIDESEKKGIITIGMTNLPSHFKIGYTHVKNYKKVRLALGMHPLMASEHEKEFNLFKKYLNYTSYIGEIGLDFSNEGITTKPIQLLSFEKVLKELEGRSKILSIHSRKAEKEVLDLLKKYKIKNAIFHWYTGSLGVMDEIISSGYYFSINPAMINSVSGRKVIGRIDKNRILTESDGPFIRLKNREIKPKDIKLVIEYLSNIYSETPNAIERMIKKNFDRVIFNLKKG